LDISGFKDASVSVNIGRGLRK